MKYADDCEAVFGYFLHHFPYVGLRGAEDLDLHHHVGERMRELYEQTYGCEYVRQQATEQSGKAGQVAFSMSTSKIAFSMIASKPPDSMNASKVAFSMNTSALARPRYRDPAPAVCPSLCSVSVAL